MRLILPIVLAVLLVGCASTKMTTYKDPEFSNVTYRSLVVSSNSQDLEHKGYMETRICQELSIYDVKCQRSIDVFPPTRKFTDEQWVQRFINSGADALVTIELTDSYSTQSYVPQSSTTTGNIRAYGNTAHYNQTTNTYGGYNVSKPVEKYKVTLIDGRNGQVAFVATSSTRGNAFADDEDLSNSLAVELAQQLEKSGFLVKAANK